MDELKGGSDVNRSYQDLVITSLSCRYNNDAIWQEYYSDEGPADDSEQGK